MDVINRINVAQSKSRHVNQLNWNNRIEISIRRNFQWCIFAFELIKVRLNGLWDCRSFVHLVSAI